MLSVVKLLRVRPLKALLVERFYPCFPPLLMHVSFLSCVVVLFFDLIWTTSLLLPISIGLEIVAKVFVTRAITAFIHRHK